MRDLLEGTASGCSAAAVNRSMGINQTQKNQNDQYRNRNQIGNDTPLESTPIYAKFRGLGFRMRELSALLKIAAPGDEQAGGGSAGGSRMLGNGMYQSAAPAGDLLLK